MDRARLWLALKFSTEEGNYDLVGNNTPVFFIRDAIKFPDFIHTIPASYRHMDGFGSHTEEAEVLVGKDPDSHQRELREAIERGEFPSWTVGVQIVPAADAGTYRFNPFDLTKVRPHADYPVIEMGRLELNRNPRNIFAEVERSIYSPAHFVPGIGPSPDKMLHGRLFAYGDAHRYRVGINADHLPVNRPHATEARTNSRDGHLYDGRHGSAKNYEPNGFDHATPAHAEDDDFVQAGNLYRLMSQEERDRLIANLAGAVSQVSREDIVERAIGNFRNADADAGFGKRLKAAVQALRGCESVVPSRPY